MIEDQNIFHPLGYTIYNPYTTHGSPILYVSFSSYNYRSVEGLLTTKYRIHLRLFKIIEMPLEAAERKKGFTCDPYKKARQKWEGTHR